MLCFGHRACLCCRTACLVLYDILSLERFCCTPAVLTEAEEEEGIEKIENQRGAFRAGSSSKPRRERDKILTMLYITWQDDEDDEDDDMPIGALKKKKEQPEITEELLTESIACDTDGNPEFLTLLSMYYMYADD